MLVAFSFFTFRDLAWIPDLNLGNYVQALTDPGFRTILLRTVTIALLVTVAVLLIAYPFTYVITFVFPRRRQWLYFLVLATLFGSYLVRIYAWRTILGSEGVINETLLSLGLIAEPHPGAAQLPARGGHRVDQLPGAARGPAHLLPRCRTCRPGCWRPGATSVPGGSTWYARWHCR